MRCFALLAPILLVAPLESLAQGPQLDTIQFSRTSYSVFENSGPIAIELERRGPLTDFGTAWMRTTARTASESDFVLFDGMITFEPGQSNLTLMIGIVNDVLVEGAEWFDVALSSPDPFCCRLGSNTVATITIEDNDLGVRFSSGYHSVTEDAGELLVEIFRFEDTTNESAAFTFEIEAEYSAKRNIDFIILTNIVTFSPGQTNTILRIGILNDADAEEVEEFVLRFGRNPDFPCCGLGSPWTRIVIVDNDRGVEFSAAEYSVPEESGEVLITLTRAGDLIANAGDVMIAIIQLEAIASIDFDAPSLEFSLHFAAGQSNLTFAVRIINDALVEGLELFWLELVADVSNLALGSQLVSEVLILDNDFGIEFVRSIYEAREGEPPQALEIQVQRIGDATQAFSVDLLIAGNATSGVDFILPTHQLHFADGQTNLAMLVAVPDDPFVDGNEFVDLFLRNATANVPLGSKSIARIYLFDNEIPVNMVDPAFMASETSGLVTAALVQPDGRIVVASPLRRLHPDGSLDVNFIPTLSGVSALAMQPDGKIVCAGTFRFFAGGQFQNCLARYNTDGTRDVFSSPLSFESKVRWVQVQAGGKILIGGQLLSDSGGSIRGIARLESWGGWDNSFNIPADVLQVDAVVLQTDGRIIIGGPFSLVGGQSREGVARLLNDGALDEGFDANLGTGAAVCALALQPDGKVLAVVSSNRVVRLSGIDGAPDPAFQTQTGTNSAIERVILQPDGKILLLGDVFGPDNNRLGAIVRLNADGSFDKGFSSAMGSTFVAWHDGRVFTAYDGKVVRLLPETPASSFSLTTNAFYLTEAEGGEAVLLQRRGNSGSTLTVDFTTGGDAVPGQDYLPGGGTIVFRPLEVTKHIISEIINDCRTESNETVAITLTNAAPGAKIGSPGQMTLTIIDDDSPGGLDFFDPSLAWMSFPTDPFYPDHVPNGAFGLQRDARIVVTRRGRIARVNPDGSQDASFAQGATICARFVGGLIGSSSCRVNAIVVTPSGHILAAGVGSILKLDPNGAIDPNFRVDALSFGFHGAVYSADVRYSLATRWQNSGDRRLHGNQWLRWQSRQVEPGLHRGYQFQTGFARRACAAGFIVGWKIARSQRPVTRPAQDRRLPRRNIFSGSDQWGHFRLKNSAGSKDSHRRLVCPREQ